MPLALKYAVTAASSGVNKSAVSGSCATEYAFSAVILVLTSVWLYKTSPP
nr:MAG TPA: hypothetical protein [Caudoviricetes sp.]